MNPMRLALISGMLHTLLCIGFALVTFGVLQWSQIGFTLNQAFSPQTFASGVLNIHPIYPVLLGIALIPPTLRELQMLNQRQSEQQHRKEQTDWQNR